MDIEREVETEGGKCAMGKKIKCNEQMDDDDFEYWAWGENFMKELKNLNLKLILCEVILLGLISFWL